MILTPFAAVDRLRWKHGLIVSKATFLAWVTSGLPLPGRKKTLRIKSKVLGGERCVTTRDLDQFARERARCVKASGKSKIKLRSFALDVKVH